MRTASASGQPMPIIRQGRVENVTAGAASVRTAIGISKNVIGVYITPDEDVYMLVGKADVTVTSSTGTVLRANGSYFWEVEPDEHIAFLQVATGGNVNITEAAS